MYIVESCEVRATAPKDYSLLVLDTDWRQWAITYKTIDKAVNAAIEQSATIAAWGDLPQRRYRVSEICNGRKIVMWSLEPRH